MRRKRRRGGSRVTGGDAAVAATALRVGGRAGRWRRPGAIWAEGNEERVKGDGGRGTGTGDTTLMTWTVPR